MGWMQGSVYVGKVPLDSCYSVSCAKTGSMVSDNICLVIVIFNKTVCKIEHLRFQNFSNLVIARYQAFLYVRTVCDPLSLNKR